MAVLKDIDNKAEEKGSALVTLWQFVKFIFVSLLAMIVQFALLNLLKLIPQIHALYNQPFSWWVFVYTVAAGGLGYFIVSNTANICAQIVAFFVNRDKTFNSSANIAVTLPIYIVFTIGLIVFSAWLNPTLKDIFVEKLHWKDTLAANTATMICAAVQFFLYFPVDKILFHKKKEEAPAEEPTEALEAAETAAEEAVEETEATAEEAADEAETAAEETVKAAENAAEEATEGVEVIAEETTEALEAPADDTE